MELNQSLENRRTWVCKFAGKDAECINSFTACRKVCVFLRKCQKFSLHRKTPTNTVRFSQLISFHWEFSVVRLAEGIMSYARNCPNRRLLSIWSKSFVFYSAFFLLENSYMNTENMPGINDGIPPRSKLLPDPQWVSLCDTFRNKLWLSCVIGSSSVAFYYSVGKRTKYGYNF